MSVEPDSEPPEADKDAGSVNKDVVILDKVRNELVEIAIAYSIKKGYFLDPQLLEDIVQATWQNSLSRQDRLHTGLCVLTEVKNTLKTIDKSLAEAKQHFGENNRLYAFIAEDYPKNKCLQKILKLSPEISLVAEIRLRLDETERRTAELTQREQQLAKMEQPPEELRQQIETAKQLAWKMKQPLELMKNLLPEDKQLEKIEQLLSSLQLPLEELQQQLEELQQQLETAKQLLEPMKKLLPEDKQLKLENPFHEILTLVTDIDLLTQIQLPPIENLGSDIDELIPVIKERADDYLDYPFLIYRVKKGVKDEGRKLGKEPKHLKKYADHIKNNLNKTESSQHPPVERLIGEELLKDLHDCRDKLKLSHREIYDLRIEQDKNEREISQELEISLPNVKSRKHRMLQALKECMKQKGYEIGGE